MKILTVVGARPQFIKASVVSREFGMHPSVTEKIIHTGQHYDDNMSELFFTQMVRLKRKLTTSITIPVGETKHFSTVTVII